MRKLLLVMTVLVLSGCAVAPTPAPPPTAVPPTQVPSFPGAGWTRAPYDKECDYECESWQFGDDVLLQVYPDGIAFGVPVGADYERAGIELTLAALAYGVPTSVIDLCSQNMIDGKTGSFTAAGWTYSLSVDDEIVVVVFLAPANHGNNG